MGSRHETCDKHDKMVHKTELHWLLSGIIVVVSAIAGVVWMYNITTFASKESVSSIEGRMDRNDRLYERIDTKLDGINNYIRGK